MSFMNFLDSSKPNGSCVTKIESLTQEPSLVVSDLQSAYKTLTSFKNHPSIKALNKPNLYNSIRNHIPKEAYLPSDPLRFKYTQFDSDSTKTNSKENLKVIDLDKIFSKADPQPDTQKYNKFDISISPEMKASLGDSLPVYTPLAEKPALTKQPSKLEDQQLVDLLLRSTSERFNPQLAELSNLPEEQISNKLWKIQFTSDGLNAHPHRPTGPYRTSVIFRWLNDMEQFERRSGISIAKDFLLVDYIRDTYYSPWLLLAELRLCNERSGGRVLRLDRQDLRVLNDAGCDSFIGLFARTPKDGKTRAFCLEDKENFRFAENCFSRRRDYERSFDEGFKFRIRKLK